MKILIDTNILLDYFQKRMPYNGAAEKIVDMCTDNVIEGCIAAHTVTNLFYILRKFYSIEERKELLLEICNLFEVVNIDVLKLESALHNEAFGDFEDSLQMECAKEAKVECIVTRNLKDFSNSIVKVIGPEDFLKLK